MAKKTKQAKRRKGNLGRLFLIIFIFAYIFFRAVPSLFAMTFKVALPESIIIEDRLGVDGIILKKESSYKSEASGYLDRINSEGERISKGSLAASIHLSGDRLDAYQRLKELDEKISRLEGVKEEGALVQGKNLTGTEAKDSLIKELQTSIKRKEYEDVEILKSQLSLEEDSGQATNLIDTNIDSLKEEKQDLYKYIKDSKINIYAKEAGIISYKIDGYEEIFSFNSREEYGYSDFQALDRNLKTDEGMEEVRSGDTIFKIMDNFQWYALLKVDNFKEIQEYEEGDSILLASDKLGEEFRGRIVNIKKEGRKASILCSFNSGFHKIYDERFLNFDIIKYKYMGYKIPSRAIVDKDGLKGVYIKEISGIVKFRPVEVIKEMDKFSYVNSGENNYIKVKGQEEPVRTISKFDEIMLNNKKLKEGMIIY